jgi:hypothetical protein
MTAVDAQEQLDFIKKVMEETRREITGDSIDFMRWGIITVIGLLATYCYIVFRLPWEHIWLIWAGLVAVGWILSIRTFMRVRKARATSYTGKLVWKIWGGCGVAFCILGFVGPMSGAYSPDYIVAVLSAVMGAAYYGTSAIFGSRWLRVFAVGWWCGSVVMFLFPVVQMLLVFAAMMIAFQIIPGYNIYRAQKKRNLVQE